MSTEWTDQQKQALFDVTEQLKRSIHELTPEHMLNVLARAAGVISKDIQSPETSPALEGTPLKADVDFALLTMRGTIEQVYRLGYGKGFRAGINAEAAAQSSLSKFKLHQDMKESLAFLASAIDQLIHKSGAVSFSHTLLTQLLEPGLNKADAVLRRAVPIALGMLQALQNAREAALQQAKGCVGGEPEGAYAKRLYRGAVQMHIDAGRVSWEQAEEVFDNWQFART